MGNASVEERREVAGRLRDCSGHGLLGLYSAVLGEGEKNRTYALYSKLADLIDPGEDVSMSAYDLLPDDDREALKWIRDHGGLGGVMDANKTNEWALSLAVIAHDALFGEDGERDTTPTEFKRELDRRLMPEGMEWLLEVWPKWSNGEYCKFGDLWKADEYSKCEPSRLTKLSIYSPEQLREWEQDEGENYGYEWNFMRPANTTYRPNKVEPPAPKVLDADGVEVREGDTVWDVYTGEHMTVEGITGTGGGYQTCLVTLVSGEQTTCDATRLTHRAPVLAADGRPLREGETVWNAGGNEFEVIALSADGKTVHIKWGNGRDARTGSCAAKDLTHERPESKCRDCAHWQKDRVWAI